MHKRMEIESAAYSKKFFIQPDNQFNERTYFVPTILIRRPVM